MALAFPFSPGRLALAAEAVPMRQVLAQTLLTSRALDCRHYGDDQFRRLCDICCF